MNHRFSSGVYRIPHAILCLLLLFPMACAGTSSSNVAVGEILTEEEGETVNWDYFIKDKTLAKKIEIKGANARLLDGFLEGQAIVHNQKKTTVPIEYKFEWFDEEGFPVESNVSLWKPDILYGKETKWLKAFCPKPGARSFKVMIREPNPVED